MEKKNILFVLIQVDEAHSSAWPAGVENQPEPQQNIEERIKRANDFESPFPVFVDTWENDFAETYHAWPDKYYHINPDMKVLHKSEYGTGDNDDALIKYDCLELVKALLL